MIVDAFWLPGLDESRVVSWQVREVGENAIRWPLLTPADLEEIVRALRQAREETLVRAGVDEIVAAIDAAAARLADPSDPLRQAAEILLPGVTGFSPAMVRLGLERMLPDWRAPELRRLLRLELGDPAVLDGFAPDTRAGARPGRLLAAIGPGLAFHVFAGNVPGVAVTSIVRSLLVKAATLGKTAAGEPILAPLFARALADVAPAIASALAVTHWTGGATELEDVALTHADDIVVYGGEEAIAALRARARPGCRLLDHGPRYSFGVVAREALELDERGRLAADIARAVAVFDQQGCVSPHVVYAERGGAAGPEELAGAVAAALAAEELQLPRGRISTEEAVAIHRARSAAEFREIAGSDARVHAGPGTSFTVVYDPDPAFTPSCLNRFLWIKPVESLEEVPALARPFGPLLQTVAMAGNTDRVQRLARALAALGASRITSFQNAPWPPPDWHHDGRGPLLELLRWTDLE